MIRIVAKMLVKEECCAQFKAAAADLVAKSAAEEGNIFYTLNTSVENERMFAFIECWKDQEAIDIHNASEHFNSTLPVLAEMCEENYPIELFREVEF